MKSPPNFGIQDKKDYQEFLDQFQGALDVEYRDLDIIAGDTVAFSPDTWRRPHPNFRIADQSPGESFIGVPINGTSLRQ